MIANMNIFSTDLQSEAVTNCTGVLNTIARICDKMTFSRNNDKEWAHWIQNEMSNNNNIPTNNDITRNIANYRHNKLQ